MNDDFMIMGLSSFSGERFSYRHSLVTMLQKVPKRTSFALIPYSRVHITMNRAFQKGFTHLERWKSSNAFNSTGANIKKWIKPHYPTHTCTYSQNGLAKLRRCVSQ